MSSSFSGCLPFCVKLVLCYYCLLSLWRNKDDDDDDFLVYGRPIVEYNSIVSRAHEFPYQS